jgi:hypothetical protein
MDHRRRSSLAVGLMLILIGAWLLVTQFVPGLQITFTWPWILIGVGLFLLVIGTLTGAPGMAVPACIVAGLGGLFYWQDATGNWESWSYVWALIPGFVGVGVVLSNLLEGKFSQGIRDGGSLILISLALFLVFGSFFGGLNVLGPYWPVLLILLGLWLLVQRIFRPR